MKKIVLAFLIFICNNSYAQNGCFEWATAFGGDTTYECISRSIIVDKNGSVYTVGEFTGTTDFDPGTSVYNLSSTGENSIFISKLNSSGNFVWAKVIQGSISAYSSDIALDNAGNIYITGGFAGAADFDPNAGRYVLFSATAPDSSSIKNVFAAFVLELDGAGNFILAKAMNMPNESINGSLSNSIAIDKFKNIYIAGNFSGTCDFDPGVGVSSFKTSSISDGDIFIVKLDSLGSFDWAKVMGGESVDNLRSLAIDSLGYVYTTGNFGRTADFDPGPLTYNLIAEYEDIFISKLDNDGNFVWAKSFVGPKGSFAQSNSITLDNSCNIYTTGNFWGNADIDFDPGPVIFNISSGPARGMFISKLTRDGNFIWAKGLFGMDCESNSLVVDVTQNVYIAGGFSGIVDFDPSNAQYNVNAVGTNVFISKFDLTGNIIFAKQIGSPQNGAQNNDAVASAITLDNLGSIYTVGKFFAKADFDPGIDIYELKAHSFNYAAFAQKMKACPLGIFSEDINESMLIYPNPGYGTIFIELPETNESSNLKIINILGEVVYDEVVNTKSKITRRIEIESYAKGIYNVVLVTKKGIVNNRLLII
jgi:hypothetical protein